MESVQGGRPRTFSTAYLEGPKQETTVTDEFGDFDDDDPGKKGRQGPEGHGRISAY